MKFEVKVKSIGSLQSGQKNDGGTWFARNVLLVTNDGSMYPDEFAVRIVGDTARDCSLRENQAYEADISFSTHEYNGKVYQDTYLRNLGESQANKPF